MRITSLGVASPRITSRRIASLAAALLAAASVASCTSTGESRSSSSSGSSGTGRTMGEELGSSGFRRSNDTLGTNERRMDVYGGATAPVLPTIGAPGFGK